MSDFENTKKKLGEMAAKNMVGRTITEVRYMTKAEQKQFGWDVATIIIFFDDHSHIIPSMDDEGNNGGALFTSFVDMQCIPVIRDHDSSGQFTALLNEADELVNKGHDRSSHRLQDIADALDMSMDDLMEGR
jgi:hypothetical protein